MSFARVRALAVIGVLVTCAAVLVAVTLFKDKQRHATAGGGCPKGAIIVNVTVPEPKDVKVSFFDAAGNPALAAGTAEELAFRRFQVTRKTDQVAQSQEVAVFRFGPQVVGAAWLLRAYFLDQATLEFQVDRTDDTVDILLGTGFKKLATASEVGQALGLLGDAQAPAGTCGMKPTQQQP